MKKINFDQAVIMVGLQDKINRKVDENWVSADYPYLRGVLVEAVEALDHYGWKWWSYQPREISQVQSELIDILHFSLSHLIGECDGDLNASALALSTRSNPTLKNCRLDGKEYQLAHCDVPQLLQLLAATAASGRNELPLLEATFHACGLSWSAVVVRYMSKHVLSIFRQNHGYAEGCYTKIWSTKEDNIHLVELAAPLDPDATDFSAQLYSHLEERYASCTLALQPGTHQPGTHS
ncbi:dUTP diphosphatase [Glaciimonas immobilis]|uniref:dUTPase n=1 Tax=Glaciimonas immobilis TaxID=728004 RepID=A0A840RU17_9BURK|nr:dUTP diphosphatase [Glaciimonas immobilis]KAF3998448.1 dUTPase [Glaciimonas immobilis]MBB5202057.1 hypothetical protein [Glaciimonas immobilis]